MTDLDLRIAIAERIAAHGGPTERTAALARLATYRALKERSR